MVRPLRRLRARPRHDDRGEVAANVVVTAVLWGMFFLFVQIALLWMAHLTARGAAQQAADVTRLENGTAAEGEALARQFLDRHSAIQDPEITVTRTLETVEVTITGHAPSPVPLLDPGVTVTLTAPVERIVDP